MAKVSYPKPRGGRTPAFEGFSKYRDQSDAESFHEAVQQAAHAAAIALKRAHKGAAFDPAWFEVSEVRVLVGNPNVKVYGVVITPSPSP
jgi:flavin-binding protein dodecin